MRTWYYLMQFLEDDRRFNYAPDDHPLTYPSNTICVFKVKIKDKRTFCQKVLGKRLLPKSFTKHLTYRP